jgi:hypothetical protein
VKSLRLIESPRRRSPTRFRDSEAERLGGLEVDDKIEFDRLLDWHVGWFLAFENAPSIDASSMVPIAEAAEARFRSGLAFETALIRPKSPVASVLLLAVGTLPAQLAILRSPRSESA